MRVMAGEAVQLHEHALANWMRVLGADHPPTLTARNNLAAAYRRADRTMRALKPYKR